MKCLTTMNPSHILSLPQELLLKISTYLDSQSAISFSTTCPYLQPSAESRIWRDIRITEKQIFGDLSIAFKSDDFSFTFDDTSNEEEESQQDLFDDLARTHSGAWALRSQAELFHLNYLLERYEWRKNYVKSLTSDLRHEIPKELIEFLKSLPSLEKLSLKFPEYPSSLLDDHRLPGFINCLTLFQSLEKTPLDRLKDVEVYLVYDWNDTVLSIIRSAPNLENLRMDGQTLHTKQSKLFNQDIQSIQRELNLKSLIVEEMHPFFVPTLRSIINSSPHLEKVSLKDEFFRWRPDAHNPLLESLAKVDSLKALEVSSNCFDALCELDGWKNVEDLKIGWSTVMLKERDNYGLVTAPFIVPPLPKLQRYQIEVSYYTTSTQGYDHLTEPSLSILAILLSRLPQELAATPELRLITYGDSSRSQEGDTWDWQDEEFQGLIIYSYTNNKGDDLFHCRSKSQHPSNRSVNRPRWMGNSAGWEEHAYYNGASIPIRLLAGIYGVAGMTSTGIEPGRGLDMKSEGWDLLKTWEKQQESWT
ncbi:hypothetical protein V865_000228 [Kwoniella europaea PYCC6329]|uniref:F-box domain-containing protein n=1 Tax=Kwoniella europaea PYCC6329 TaxID=1423913 RepID=A0AAX4K986_9TREE